MSQKIHYENNLFILSVFSKNLLSCLKIDADPESCDKLFLSQFTYLGSAIDHSYNLLMANPQLIDHKDYSKLLSLVLQSLLASYELLAEQATALSTHLFQQLKDFDSNYDKIKTMLASLQQTLSSTPAQEAASADLVSKDELSQLLG